MRIRIAFFLLTVFSSSVRAQVTVAADATPRLWGDLQPGKYAVGFKTIFLRDSSRNWSSEGVRREPDAGRPIIVNLWYPVEAWAQNGRPMVYGDYLHYEAPLSLRKLTDTLETRDRASWQSDIVDLTPDADRFLTDLFSTPVESRRNATAATGSFPLVMYAAGLRSRSDANAILAEYLASHGYYVVSVPQLGPSEKMIELGSSPEELRLREQDIEFAWTRLRSLGNVNGSATGVIGHSAGGVVALLFAMRVPQTKAVVSLDGSFGMAEGAGNTLRVPGFDGPAVRAPLLDLRRDEGVQDVKLDSSVFLSLARSDRYQARFKYMWHGDFTEWGDIARVLHAPLPSSAASDGRTRETGYVGNQHAYRATLDFLDAHLYGRRSGEEEALAELANAPGVVVRHVPAAK